MIGESRRGLPIVAKRQGRADAKRVLLVLGQMHGDEPYGRYVVDQVRKLKPRKNTAVGRSGPSTPTAPNCAPAATPVGWT